MDESSVDELLAVLLRIALGAAVAEAPVEVAVRPEGKLAAVVVGERLRHLQDDALARHVHRARR